MTGYGCSLNVGIGVPIPILNEEIARFTAVSDDEIFVPVVDYGWPIRKMAVRLWPMSLMDNSKQGKYPLMGGAW